MTTTRRLFSPLALLTLVLASPTVFAQSPSRSPAPVAADTATARPVATDTTAAKLATATPATPASPVSSIRNKLSAGDLLSAESILEVHRDKHGEDGPYLAGLSWLARGALLVGENDKARRYAADTRARCERKRAAGDSLERDREYETALGAAIEVEAQLLEKERGAKAAAAFVRAEIPKITGPVSLRSRLYKRLDLLTMVGDAAPALSVEDHLGDPAPALSGQPTMLFLWAEWCGDCKAQAAALAKAHRRWADKGVRLVAVTRFYEPDSNRVHEKARVDSVWKADYADLAGVPIVFSTASMERYGVSSTPTFAFIDRAGIVRRYTPTRLTGAELDRTLTSLAK